MPHRSGRVSPRRGFFQVPHRTWSVSSRRRELLLLQVPHWVGRVSSGRRALAQREAGMMRRTRRTRRTGSPRHGQSPRHGESPNASASNSGSQDLPVRSRNDTPKKTSSAANRQTLAASQPSPVSSSIYAAVTYPRAYFAHVAKSPLPTHRNWWNIPSGTRRQRLARRARSPHETMVPKTSVLHDALKTKVACSLSLDEQWASVLETSLS